MADNKRSNASTKTGSDQYGQGSNRNQALCKLSLLANNISKINNKNRENSGHNK